MPMPADHPPHTMKRRTFLQKAAFAGSGLALTPTLLRGRDAEFLAHRDKFGGWPAYRFKPTGFFRLEKRDRWWFVTPEGNAFLSLGMNHVHQSWLNQAHNAEHWRKAFGAERYRDEKWKAGLRAKVVSDMDAFGYNTLGVHNSFGDFVPHIEAAWIKPILFVVNNHSRAGAEWEFPDVFSKEFERHCDAVAKKEIAETRDDPWLLGYAMTDCPILTEIDAAPRPTHVYGSVRTGGRTWPRVIRNLPASSPGKQAYVELMRSRHSSWILQFNEVYGTQFTNWDELLKAVDWRPDADLTNGKELQDNHAFLEKVAERQYSVMTGAVRRHDPNHLIFGDKLNANTDSGDAVVHITSKYTDLVFYQMYGRFAEQRPVLARWAEKTDKPFFNGDGSFAAPHVNMPNPHGPHAVDQEHRAELAEEFCEKMFRRGDFVGWSVCGWVDTWNSMAQKKHKQHSGIQDAFGKSYEPLRRTLSEFSRRMYRVAGRG